MMARSTTLQPKAGYIDARPLTTSSPNLLAPHGRTIHAGSRLGADKDARSGALAHAGSIAGGSFGATCAGLGAIAVAGGVISRATAGALGMADAAHALTHSKSSVSCAGISRLAAMADIASEGTAEHYANPIRANTSINC
jgi:hypothetical protein